MTVPGGMPPASRDLAGYGPNPPDPQWPGGARLALSFVVNVEEGAELSLGSGDERNEPVYETVNHVAGTPDPAMESHFAYGSRVAVWRLLDLFDAYGVKATFSACGRAVAATPALAAAPTPRRRSAASATRCRTRRSRPSSRRWWRRRSARTRRRGCWTGRGGWPGPASWAS